MFIVYIVIIGVLIGLTPKILKKSDKILIHIVFALAGAFVGSFMVFGDSPLLLQYTFFSPVLMSIPVSAVFVVFSVLLIKKSNKTLIYLIPAFFVLLVTVFFWLDSNGGGTGVEGEVVISNFEECQQAGYPTSGAYPGECNMRGRVFKEKLVVSDFDTCVLAGNPVMESYPRRCRHEGVTYIEEVFNTYTHTKGSVNYSVQLPFGWYAHENGDVVVFTQERELNVPKNTEGFAIGPHFNIIVSNIFDIDGVESYDDWLDMNGMKEESELFIESKDVRLGDYSMKRIVTEAAGAGGNVLHYVYFVDIQRAVVFSQYPYDENNEISKVFEEAVGTFKIN